jgi:hypothetical protein
LVDAARRKGHCRMKALPLPFHAGIPAVSRDFEASSGSWTGLSELPARAEQDRGGLLVFCGRFGQVIAAIAQIDLRIRAIECLHGAKADGRRLGPLDRTIVALIPPYSPDWSRKGLSAPDRGDVAVC